MLALLLVDHGSRRPEANQALGQVAAMVGGMAGAAIHVAFAHMELASPTIAEGFRDCVAAGATEVTVHPYMLLPGRHAVEDLPRLVATAAAPYPGVSWRVTEPLGIHEGIARAVLDRCGVSTSAAR